jgi:mono/diheme cytochrome c family protein
MKRTAALVALLLLGPAACRRTAQPPRDAVQQAFRDGSLMSLEAQGKRVFVERCATCHGREGRGDGQNAYNLHPPPPDFPQSLPKLTPADRRRVIEDGTAALGRSPLCPPRGGSLDDAGVSALLAYLEVLARPQPSPTPTARRRWRTVP